MTCDGYQVPPHEVEHLICIDIDAEFSDPGPDWSNEIEMFRADYCEFCHERWEKHWYEPRYGARIL